MVKFLWIKVENTRPVELETTQIRNVNSLIHFLKNRFELSTPEHLLILKLAGNEIPSDAAVETLVSSFKDPLELISIDTTQQPSAPRYRPMNPNQASLPIEENQFQFLESPPFLGNVGQAANREYFKIPVKPFILVILLLGCIDSFALVIWVIYILIRGFPNLWGNLFFESSWILGNLTEEGTIFIILCLGNITINSGETLSYYS